MNIATLAMSLNGAEISFEAAPGARLSEVLRERLGARDVKVGCNAGDCGACTVLIDGEPVCACMTSAARAAGTAVETLAGLVKTDPLAQRLKEAFLRHGAAQCGICTPGVMVAAVALLRRTASPDEQEVKDALGGVLCRCTGYRLIIDAVLSLGSPAPETSKPVNGRGVGAAIPRLDGGAGT